MTQPRNVLYLPPGVAAPATPPPTTFHTGLPFDSTFFSVVLPASIRAFCEQSECDCPIVQVLTVDGARHYVRGISGASDLWVALHTTDPDHDHALQVFLPYQTIHRVEIHAGEGTQQRRLGFIAGETSR